jgi:carbon starvation protein
MLVESFVAVMALIAACALTPGVYFAINAPVAALGTTAQSAAAAVASWGFVVTPAEMEALARQVGETTLLSRTGGAPSLAVGMAHIFSGMLGGGGAMALWYHFAIMFEALFILTTLDAGTRVGRFMLQDLGRHAWPRFGSTSWPPAVVLSSAIFVAMWGWFLWQGVVDPLGGINSLWPLFGISNPLLAAVALCVATTSAGWQKLYSPLPKLGFLAHAHALQTAKAAGTLPPGVRSAGDLTRLIANDYLDAAVAAFFLLSVLVVIADSAREWWAVLKGGKPVRSTETPFEPRVVAGD